MACAMHYRLFKLHVGFNSMEATVTLTRAISVDGRRESLVGGRLGGLDEGSQKVQTSSYTINKYKQQGFTI